MVWFYEKMDWKYANPEYKYDILSSSLPALVAPSDARLTDDQEVAGSVPTRSTIFFVEIDHEIFSMVILFSPQLSVSGERMCTSTG